MALFDWEEKYSVGIQRFDEQHKTLVGLLNRLYSAMSAGETQEVLGKLLDDLVSYTKTHFAAEEQLMQQHNYPEFKAHKQQHDQLTAEVSELTAQFRSGSRALGIKTGAFLKEWLYKHIQGTDKRYEEYFHDKGIR